MSKGILPVLFIVLVVAVWAIKSERRCSHTGYSPFLGIIAVCGSDGLTYNNREELEFLSCYYSLGTTVAREGFCTPEEEKRFNKALKISEKRYRKSRKEKNITDMYFDGMVPNMQDFLKLADDYDDDDETTPAPTVKKTKQ